jgi:hypothetical protein
MVVPIIINISEHIYVVPIKKNGIKKAKVFANKCSIGCAYNEATEIGSINS